MKFSSIYEGWRNRIIPPKLLKKIIKEAREDRLVICRNCEEHSSNKKDYSSLRIDEHCTYCGCTLSAKTSCLTCECPLKYWEAKITVDELKEITK